MPPAGAQNPHMNVRSQSLHPRRPFETSYLAALVEVLAGTAKGRCIIRGCGAIVRGCGGIIRGCSAIMRGCGGIARGCGAIRGCTTKGKGKGKGTEGPKGNGKGLWGI